MKLTSTDLSEIIIAFAQQYICDYQKAYGHLPTVEADEAWPSPCVVEDFDQVKQTWSYQAITEKLSFENVESALDVRLHQDIKTYFTTIYSESIAATCSDGQLSLLFAWSKQDFARLQENIIGHILMKRRLKQTETIFFAVTDEEDMILSVKNDNGEVWVERVGCVPHKKLANSLAEFIAGLTPYTQLG